MEAVVIIVLMIMKVVVVGTDAPGVTREVAEEAFGKLDGADLVLGPATDGGYYLIGMSRPLPGLFQTIPWSTEQVLEATLGGLGEKGPGLRLWITDATSAIRAEVADTPADGLRQLGVAMPMRGNFPSLPPAEEWEAEDGSQESDDR